MTLVSARAQTVAVRDLFLRSTANPLLTPADWPYPVNAVINPAAAMVDGETVLLCRVEDRRGASHLTVARSADGVTGWRIDPWPLIVPDRTGHVSRWGVEDPRTSWVAELGCWLITYAAYGPQGPCVALACTEDFRTVEHIGVAVPPEDKNAALLPRHIDGGMGPPPLETPYGWLGIYHGVKQMPTGVVYRAGLVLLDVDNPVRVLRRSDDWPLAPTEPYERIGPSQEPAPSW